MDDSGVLTLVEAQDLRPPVTGLELREISVGQALSRNPLPGLDYGLNPYVGCFHGCRACYVPSLLHRPMEEWGQFVLIKRNLPAILAREVRSLPRGLVAISTATDPYQYLEAKYFITRHCLEVLSRSSWPVSILTRSPLLLRDTDLFKGFEDIEVGMSVPTVDDEARRALEPMAPSIPSRLRALKRLSDQGFRTFISFAPAYPPTGGLEARDIAEVLAVTGARKIYFRTLDLRPGIRTALLERMNASPLGSELVRIVDESLMGPFLKDLARECARCGMTFRPYRGLGPLGQPAPSLSSGLP